MIYEVQKACLIPVLSGYFRQDETKGHTQELWQPVGKRHLNKVDAFKELERFREWNKGKNLHYRLVVIVEEKKK